MKRALVVVEATEASKRLIREAGELAKGVDAELILMHITTEEEYRRTKGELESIAEIDTTYSLDKAEEGARQFVNDIAQEALEDMDVEYETLGVIGKKDQTVVDEANKRNCDHIFMAGKKRSPTGKALFGDEAQSVILNFDGPVTVITE